MMGFAFTQPILRTGVFALGIAASGRLAFPSRSADISAGGWRWTSHSPTGSGPEGSSPNELRFGSLVSLPLIPTWHELNSAWGPRRSARHDERRREPRSAAA